jgi:hypothetical protein
MNGRMSKGNPDFGVYWLGPGVPKLLQPCNFATNFVPSKFQSVFSFEGEFLYFFWPEKYDFNPYKGFFYAKKKKKKNP